MLAAIGSEARSRKTLGAKTSCNEVDVHETPLDLHRDLGVGIPTKPEQATGRVGT